MANILEVKNVTKCYGALTALDNVSLTVAEGRILGLLGPNGSGKTTLIKLINGLLLDYQGTLTVGGFKPGVETKAMVAYLPDRDVLPGWMSIRQAVRMYKDFYADFDEPRAMEMLETLKVDANKAIRQLSKGMREKLQLTLTMARRARLYVLDEPIAGVDPAAREVILSTILRNFSDNGSILLSTHIISDVEAIFDDVVFLKEGKIVLSQDAESLRTERNQSLDQLFREVFKC